MQNVWKSYPKGKVIVAALLLALLAAAYSGSSLPSKQRADEPAVINSPPSHPNNENVQPIWQGSVVRAVPTPVHSQFAGRIQTLYVAEGQSVKRGQQLLVIAPAAGQPPSSLGADEYGKALQEYQRLQKLYDMGAIPRRQVEQAAARLQAAKGQPAAGQSSGLKEPVELTASFDGVVTGLAVSPGGVVQSGQQLLAIGSGEPFEIIVTVEEQRVGVFRLGSAVEMRAAGENVRGRVTAILPQPQGNGVPSFLCRISLHQPTDGRLQEGMTVHVALRGD